MQRRFGHQSSRSNRVRYLITASALAALSNGPSLAWATNGTWNPGIYGNWSSTSSWVGGAILGGVGSVGVFNAGSAASILTPTVVVDSSRTVGTISFTSVTGSFWTLDKPILPGPSMTLATSTGQPTIFVDAKDSLNVVVPVLGSQGFRKTGAGIIGLGGVNSYTGTTVIAGGTLLLGNSGSIGATVQVVNGAFDLYGKSPTIANLNFGDGATTSTRLNVTSSQANATLSLTGGIQYSGLGASGGISPGTLGVPSALTSGQHTIGLSGSVSNSAYDLLLTKSIGGTGGLTISAASLRAAMLTQNSYTGSTTVQVGTLYPAAFNSIPSGSDVAINGGQLSLLVPTTVSGVVAGSYSQSIKSLSGVAGGSLRLGQATLSVNQSTITTFAGAIADSGRLLMQGTGQLNLTAVDPAQFTGTLAVSGGVMQTNVLPPSVTATGGRLVVATSDADGAGAGIKGAASAVSRVTTLSISSLGRLDLRNNGLIFPSTATLNGTTISVSTLRSILINGRGGTGTGLATWNGSGGITSSSFTGDEVVDSIGYVWMADPNLLVPPTTLNGKTFSSTDYLVKYCAGADANLDGRVDDTDVAVMGLTYDRGVTTGRQWYEADFNYDGRVDDSDVAILGLSYSPKATPLSPVSLAAWSASDATSGFAAGAGAVVPEPASLSLLTLSAISLIRRRKQ